MKLEWADDAIAAPEAEAAAEVGKWSIFSAVRYQLGLKLEAARGLLEVLIIDHVEKASEN